MKNILSVNFRLARPKAHPGKGDKYLPKIIQDLSNLQRKTQKDFHYDTLRLSADKIRDLSQTTLVEFAEDVKHEKKPKPVKGLDGMYSLKRLSEII
jgi:hypothetical protein